MASQTQRTLVCANSRRWQRTGKPGALQAPGSQRAGYDLVIKQINKRNNGSDSMLPQQRVQIQSLVRDLRSCKPYGMANKKKGKIIIIIKQDSLSTTVTQKCLRCLRLEHGARMAYISASADSTRFTSQRRNTSPLLFGISQIAKKKKKIIFSGSHWHN